MDVREVRIRLVNKYCEAAKKINNDEKREEEFEKISYILDEITALDNIMLQEYNKTFKSDSLDYE